MISRRSLSINAKFPIALDFFYSMNKRIRKYGGSFLPATQNIADWNANEELRSKYLYAVWRNERGVHCGAWAYL